MKRFSGVWATFEYLDEMTSAIKAVRKKGINPPLFLPVLAMKLIMRWGIPKVNFLSLLLFSPL